MSGTVKVSIGLEASNTGLVRSTVETKSYVQTTADWAAQQYQSDTTAAGVACTPTVTGTAGNALFQLLSLAGGATYVELGVRDGGGVFVAFARLQLDSGNVPDRALLPIANGATIYAKTDAGTAQLYVTVTPR